LFPVRAQRDARRAAASLLKGRRAAGTVRPPPMDYKDTLNLPRTDFPM